MNRSHSARIALAITLALSAVSAHAQTPAAAPPVVPAGVAALESMSRLPSRPQVVQVEAITTTDDVLDDGQKIQYSGRTLIVAEMPNKLFAEVSNDRQADVRVRRQELHAVRAPRGLLCHRARAGDTEGARRRPRR